MCIPFADAGSYPLAVRLSTLVLISLASCARADPPEMFVADPSLQDDYTNSLPATGSSLGFDYQIIQGLAIFEGDILLGEVNSSGDLSSRLQGRGVGKNDAFNRWPDGIIVYETPASNSPVQRETVAQAIEHWTEHTTLSFVERTSDNADQYPHYIQFRDTQSCASHVGMIGGPQPIYISDACSVGSVIHEIGHAVGLFHEHTRPDRDNFVQIDWSEIVDGKDINFNLQTANIANYSVYDYGSIMHYGPEFFSMSGRPTIIVSDEIEIGQRDALSPLDIVSANKMYETDLALGTPSISVTSGNFEIDLTIYNQGDLGAHQLQLMMKLGDDAQWRGVSRNSGWDCLTFGSELKCTRNTLREQTESRFTVQADAGNAKEEDLSMVLASRTQDSSPGNNSMNDDGLDWKSLNVDLKASSEDQTAEPVAETIFQSNPPPLSAANETELSPRMGIETAKASAGRMPLSMLALLLTIMGLRRVDQRIR